MFTNAIWETREIRAEGKNDVDPEDLENREEDGREAQGAEVLSGNRIDNVSPGLRRIKIFRGK